MKSARAPGAPPWPLGLIEAAYVASGLTLFKLSLFCLCLSTTDDMITQSIYLENPKMKDELFLFCNTSNVFQKTCISKVK